MYTNRSNILICKCIYVLLHFVLALTCIRGHVWHTHSSSFVHTVPVCLNFVCWLYNRPPGWGLPVTEKLRQLLLRFWHYAPVAFYFLVCFSLVQSCGTPLPYVHSWRGLLTTVVSRFDGSLSTLLFYEPKISGLPRKPWYLIMWMQEVFSSAYFASIFRCDWILQKPSQWKNVFW